MPKATSARSHQQRPSFKRSDPGDIEWERGPNDGWDLVNLTEPPALGEGRPALGALREARPVDNRLKAKLSIGTKASTGPTNINRHLGPKPSTTRLKTSDQQLAHRSERLKTAGQDVSSSRSTSGRLFPIEWAHPVIDAYSKQDIMYATKEARAKDFLPWTDQRRAWFLYTDLR
jgi:hypothetical protein